MPLFLSVESLLSPEDASTSSASFCVSPAEKRALASPLCASTPLAPPAAAKNGETIANGYDTHDAPVNDEDKLNGNVHVNAVVTQSTTSMDVLSGGESEAGDTLTRQNNNNVVSPSKKDGTLEPAKKRTHDIEYFVAKELLMTERTYKRDLELITVRWSAVVSQLSLSSSDTAALARACLALGEIVLPSGALLAKLEKMLCSPNTPEHGEPEYKKIAKLLYDHLSSNYDVLMSYTNNVGGLVGVVESLRRRVPLCGRECAAFDAGAALPLAGVLLRPLHRLLQHERHAADLSYACGGAGAARAAAALAAAARAQLRHVEHHAAMCQLSRDIVDYDKILVADREFVRLGCVYKHSSMGIQQRMLFLFNDILVISSKWGSHEYKAHKVLALHKLQLKAAELPHSFLLIGDDVNLLISTSNEAEYRGWVDALQTTVEDAAAHPRDIDTELTPRTDNGTQTNTNTLWSRVVGAAGALGDSVTQVCWHRATSLSRDQLHAAMQTHLSGYLLRKFKKSPGWQKLWVVLAANKMTFYKSWQDDAPLAALPLHGYSLKQPCPSDNIDKDFVFKLEYKTHVYFFRADSQYTYNRWTEVLQSAMVKPYKEQS